MKFEVALINYPYHVSEYYFSLSLSVDKRAKEAGHLTVADIEADR